MEENFRCSALQTGLELSFVSVHFSFWRTFWTHSSNPCHSGAARVHGVCAPRDASLWRGIISRLSKILTLALLDAFTCTVLFRFFNHGVQKVGGQRQKPYHNSLTLFLPTTLSQRISIIVIFVHQCCPEEILNSLNDFYRTAICVFRMTHFEATVEVYLSSLKRRFIAVYWKWFNQYISMRLDTFYDCYIAEYDISKNKIMLFVSIHTNTK